MTTDFQGQRLQGRSLRGQNLAGACFARADIRGADLGGSNLTGADFRQAQAGLGRWWPTGYWVASAFVAVVVGVIVGSAASALARVITKPPTTLAVWLQVVLSAVAVLVAIALPALLLSRGLGASVTGLAVFAGVAVLLAPIAPKEVTGTCLLLLAGFGGLLAGSVLLAIVFAVLHSSTGGRWAVAPLLLSVLVAAPAVWETTVGFRNSTRASEIAVPALLIAGLVTLSFFPLGIYLARRAMAGDSRYALVRTAIIGLLGWGSTSFKGADLTDASFVEATMTFADLRGAILTRTDWQNARQLDRARVDRTYLADPKLRQLAATKRGAGQAYDDLNLEGLNLQDGDLANASFIGANLSSATLRRANLAGAKLAHTQLHDTDLSEACLTGAFIEHWGISTRTRFDGVRCDYVYMHLPTAADPDPMRKPDDNDDFFQAGDFTDFIAPIIRTLEYYHQQHSDPRNVTRTAKTLDLMQRDAIDPAISALALLQLAQRHPEADLEVVSLKSKGSDTVQIRALVSDQAQRATMSEEFQAIYAAMSALPRVEMERLVSNLVHKSEPVRQLAAMVLAAVNNDAFYAETRIKPGGTVKCLMVAANPLPTVRLRLDEEFREITAKLRASEYRDVFQLIAVPAARPDDLLQTLNQHRPKIVQFSGHGAKTGELIFLDNQGNAKPIAPAALTILFQALKDDIRLVILNACYSESQAQALAEVIDCVVGMSDAISDDAAIAFIASFYRALGFGRSIQNAFDQGLAALGLEGLDEQATPRLVTRPGVDPTQVILAAPDPLVPLLPIIR